MAHNTHTHTQQQQHIFGSPLFSFLIFCQIFKIYFKFQDFNQLLMSSNYQKKWIPLSEELHSLIPWRNQLENPREECSQVFAQWINRQLLRLKYILHCIFIRPSDNIKTCIYNLLQAKRWKLWSVMVFVK